MRACGPAGGDAPEDGRPNVLVVMWDTVRADRLSLYGYERPTTPRLDAFADGAVVYEQAVSPGMWTLPSHAAVFTGLPGTTHGADAHHRWLDHQHVTLAEILGDAGYDTFAMSSNLIASPMANLLQGFQTVHTTFPRAGERRGRYVRAARRHAADKLVDRDASTEISPAFAGRADELWGKAVYKDAAPVLHRGLVDFLEERDGERPWFAYLNMMEAHTPRIPSMKSRRALLDDDLIELALATDTSLFAENEYIVGVRDYDDRQLAAISGTYDAALRDLDEATGDLLDDLAARGVLDDTVVIVMSDHGEALGEHRRFEHRWSVYEHLLRVPLVIRYPKRLQPARIDARVSTIDVFATVIDLTGVPAPPVDGRRSRSLVDRRSFDRHVFVQMLDPFASQLSSIRAAYPDVDLSPLLRTYAVIYEEAHKVVHASDGGHQLFDVHADPGELHDLWDARPQVAQRLERALAAWEEGLTPYDPSGRTARDGAAHQDDETRAQLRLLGYLDDGGDEPPHGEGR